MVRGDARPNSDIDLLVEIEPGRTLLDVIALEQDLEELLGRPVDVLTDGGLSPYLQKRILAEATAGNLRLHSCAKVGGGGGSRTRVREYVVVGVYMRSRS